LFAQQRAEAGAVPITKIDIAMSMEVKLFMGDLLSVSPSGHLPRGCDFNLIGIQRTAE
jgi:hypothetical protein